jgi:acyl transferase domain-containing protein
VNVGAPQNGVHIFSSVTGEEKLSGFGAEYWVKNLVSRVRYSDGLRSLCYSLSEEKNAGPLSVTFLELGPHPALAGPTRQILGDVQIPNLEMSYTSALVRNKDARITVLDMAGKLFQAGIHIDLQAANLIGAPSTNVGFESTPVVLTDLPPYSWDHSKRYWHESRLSKNYRLRRHPYHDLLGLRVLLGSICDPTWRHILTVDQLPWLKDHVVDGFVIFPGSGYLCMVIEAAAQLAEENKTNQNVKQFRIRNVHLIKALVIPESPEKVEVQLIMRTTGKPHDSLSTWTDFTIVSLSSQGHHSEHCTGSVMIEYIEEPIDSELSLENSRLEEEQTAWARRCMEECSAPVFQEAVYDTMRKCGNDYGPSFSNLTEFQYHQHSAEGLARIRVPDIVAGMPAQFLQPHRIHPTTLDTIAHSSLPVYTKHYKPGAMMPIRIGELCIGANVPNQPGAELIAAVELVPLGSRSAAANIVVFDETHDGFLSPVVTLSNMEVVVMGQEATPATSDTGSPRALTIDWVQDPDFLSDEVKIQKELDNALLSIIPDSDPELADILGSRIKQAIERLNSADVAHHVDSNLQEQLSQWIKRYATMKEGNCWLTKFMDISKNIMQVYRRASQYLEQFSQARGSLKVLEAGAGCGVATRSLIEALKKPEKSRVWGDYEIASDTSNIPSKLLEGCEKGLSYTSLNINQDPLVQGHAAGSYDVIILNSFLHLSASVTTTLASVHPLLKPGGVLIMVGTTGELAHNSIYGLLNDFWKGMILHVSFALVLCLPLPRGMTDS